MNLLTFLLLFLSRARLSLEFCIEHPKNTALLIVSKIQDNGMPSAYMFCCFCTAYLMAVIHDGPGRLRYQPIE